MKKTIAAILALSFLTLTACGSMPEHQTSQPDAQQTELTTNADTDPDTGEEAGYIREIKYVASQYSVILHWHTLSMIEASLTRIDEAAGLAYEFEVEVKRLFEKYKEDIEQIYSRISVMLLGRCDSCYVFCNPFL